MKWLAGWASTPSIDEQDYVVELGAFTLPTDAASIPLLCLHDREKPAGEITKLEWCPEGLWIECTAADEYADLPAFSVGFHVTKYEIAGTGPQALGVVKRATLFEVSLVERPCNAECLVLCRTDHAPIVAHRAPYAPLDLQPLIKATDVSRVSTRTIARMSALLSASLCRPLALAVLSKR